MGKMLSRMLVSSGFLAVLFTTGCSSSPPISVSVTASSMATDAGQTITFSATIMNDRSYSGVTWGLSGSGSLTGATTNSVTYVAASNVTSSQMVTVTATSVADPTKSASLQITVNPPPQINPFQTLANGTTGTAYSQTIAESGGTAPFKWSVYSGGFPAGLSLGTNTGAISGTPTGAGMWYFEAQVTDAVGLAYYAVLSVQINSNLPPGNPVPFVNQPLIPDTAAPGGAEFTLTVNGTGFLSGAVVNLNGAPLTTTFVNNHQLTAVVPASAIASAGTASVTVVNPAPGGGSSNVVYFPVATPESAVNFTEAPNSPFPAYYAISVAAADFNNDGKPDLAIAFNSQVSTMLGNGDGTFTQATGSPIRMQPPPWDSAPTPYTQFLAVGDFNNSQNLGLAVVLFQNQDTTILLGNGNGSFTPSSAFSNTLGAPSVCVVTADFNGDGNLDLAMANSLTGIPLLVSLGYGDGAFTPVSASPFGLFTGATAIAVGDFNGDGKLDLAVATYDPTVATSGAITIFLGNGDGTFTQASGSPIAVSASYSIAVADFNGDGKLDLAIASYGANNVTVLLGNGDGTFTQAPGSPIAVGNAPYAVVTGDFVGSGKLGLAVANLGDNDVSILLGNGDGTFTPASGSPIPVGKGPYSLAVADFNGSGRLGLAVANLTDGTVSVLLQH